MDGILRNQWTTSIGIGGRHQIGITGRHAPEYAAKQVFPGKQIHNPLNGCTGNGFMMQRMTEAIRKKLPL